MLVAAALLSRWIRHPEVNYVTTKPGRDGVGIAWRAEFTIAFLLMAVVLMVSNTPRLARFAGLCVAACVFLFITFEAPLSGAHLCQRPNRGQLDRTVGLFHRTARRHARGGERVSLFPGGGIPSPAPSCITQTSATAFSANTSQPSL